MRNPLDLLQEIIFIANNVIKEENIEIPFHCSDWEQMYTSSSLDD